MDELGVLRRRGDRDIPLADDLREVGVVARVGTEGQPQAGILVGVHRRPTNANTDPHDAVIRQEAIQIQFQFGGPRQDQGDRRRGRRLARDRIGPRHRLGADKRGVNARFAVEQLLLIVRAARLLLVGVRLLGVLLRFGLFHLLGHRDDISDGLGTLAGHDRAAHRLQPELAIGLELHGGNLQQFRAILEAILGRGLRRQLGRQRVRQSQQILDRILVFVVGQAAERRMILAIAANQRGVRQFLA